MLTEGSLKRRSVKASMVDDRRAGMGSADLLKDLGHCRCPDDVVRGNPVKAGVVGRELIFRVYEAVALVDNLAVPERDNPDCADAGLIRVGRLNVYRNKIHEHSSQARVRSTFAPYQFV